MAIANCSGEDDTSAQPHKNHNRRSGPQAPSPSTPGPRGSRYSVPLRRSLTALRPQHAAVLSWAPTGAHASSPCATSLSRAVLNVYRTRDCDKLAYSTTSLIHAIFQTLKRKRPLRSRRDATGRRGRPLARVAKSPFRTEISWVPPRGLGGLMFGACGRRGAFF